MCDHLTVVKRISPTRGHTGFVQSVAYSADGTRLASGSSDGTARVWNVRNLSAPPLLLQNPGAVIYSVVAAQQGSRAADRR